MGSGYLFTYRCISWDKMQCTRLRSDPKWLIRLSVVIIGILLCIRTLRSERKGEQAVTQSICHRSARAAVPSLASH